ncbi:MAG: hemD [Paucimonas sp.]|nr:hemD [Paucimonas sp.]
MPETVIITRPLQQAEPLAQRVRAAGAEAVLFPLLEILPLADDRAIRQALDGLEQYALVVFVSPNAIDAAFGYRARWPEGLTIGVMGEGSRQALARHGIGAHNARVISPRHPDRTDSETLLAQLDLPGLRGQRALLIRGESGRELLGEALRAAGVTVDQVAAYRRAAPAWDAARAQALDRLLDSQATWVITSSEALRNLAAMASRLPQPGSRARLLRSRLLVPHIRIEETARELGFTCIQRSGSGDEHMLATLQLR